MNSVRRLFNLWQEERTWISLGALTSLLSLLSAILLMALAGWMVGGAGSGKAVAGIALLGVIAPKVLMRLLVLLRTLLRYSERLVTHEATFRILAKLRIWFMKKAIPLSPKKLGSFRSGDLLNRMMADIDALDHFYLRFLVPVVVAAITCSLLILFLGVQSYLLALIALVFFLLAGWLLPKLGQSLGNAPGKNLVEEISEMRSLVIEDLQGSSELLIYGGQRSATQRLRQSHDRLSTSHHELARVAGASTGLSQFLSHLLLLSLFGGGVWLISEGDLKASHLVLNLFVVLTALEALALMPTAFLFMGKTKAAADRLFQILDHDETRKTTAAPIKSPHPITFNSVSFRYDETADVLDEVSLEFDEGTWTTILGPSGSGKSSLLNLILGFWETNAGSVTLGGIDTKTSSPEEILKHCAYLSQRPHIFSGTVKDNLLLAKPDASETEMWAALKKVDLKVHFQQRKEELDTWLGEFGLGLSGGQQRRLALAQIFLKNSPILLLDEPTENLDIATEKAIYQAIFDFAKGKTLILVTHRAIDLQVMDQLVLIDEGRVLDQGPPKELLKRHAFLKIQDAS